MSALAALILQRCAAASALFALVAAACNLIGLAIYCFAASCTFMIVHGLLLAYRRLPELDQRALLSQRAVRRTAAASIILATVISCLYWYASSWLPLDRLTPEARLFLQRHWSKLDFTPAVFAQALPGSWRSGFHQHFNSVTYCFPGPHWWESMRYLRAAIPGYSLLLFGSFSVAQLLAAAARRVLRR